MSSTDHHAKGSSAALALGALGVVYGDIGTSPLYTFFECIHHPGFVIDEASVLGVASLLFWSLTLVVTLKYVAVILRADNRGEGGILALLTLLPERLRAAPGGQLGLVSVLVIAGAALLFGDGVITPAISVLSAMEGLTVAEKGLAPYVVPATVAILVGLFAIQSRGTGSLGRFFGPVMLVWFAVIGGLGLWSTVQHPGVWAALSPHHAAHFLFAHGFAGLGILGSVVLAVTGGEALYADMGHFGRFPIRVAWLAVAYPCLSLAYLGQAALILSRPEAAASPFFAMVPTGGWTYALVVLAGVATIIASQALISAVFSLTHQAIRLGYMPRVAIRHTSSAMEGQIYVPLANWALAICTITLVVVFQHSARLAAAFGLAVSGTMAITSVVFGYVTWHVWKWPRWATVLVVAAMLALDIPFFAATCLKFFDGGYIPFALGAGLFLLMTTFVAGRALLGEHLAGRSAALPAFIAGLQASAPNRLPGLAVVMASSTQGVPALLKLAVERFRSVYEHVFLLTVTTEAVPYVEPADRLKVEPLGANFYRVQVRSGFMEAPVVPSAVLHAIREVGLDINPKDVVYMLGRESFVATNRGKMSAWREQIFAFLARNASDPTQFYGLPPHQVLELGSRVDL